MPLNPAPEGWVCLEVRFRLACLVGMDLNEG